EDWIMLTRAEWAKLLPRGDVRAGTSWEFDKEVSARILERFFPPTENTDFQSNSMDDQCLTAHVESVQGCVARARIEGKLRMKHRFYHKDDDNFVEATLVGFMDFEPANERIRSLRLVTDTATYGGNANAVQFFGVAVRSVP